jgi:hypothetical protein
VEHRVAGDAGVIDQDVDRAEIGLDLLQAGRAGVERGDIPFVDGDAGLAFELLCRLVIAAVIGGDLVARAAQCLGNRRADPTRSPRHHCDAWHAFRPW